MTDEELKRLLEANTERIERRFDAVDKRFETMDKKIDDTASEIRRQFGTVLEHSDREFKGLAEVVALLDEKVDRKANAIEQRMDLGFADTQAMIKFSHAELDRRVRYMEQTLSTLEDRFVGLQARVDRLEVATKTEN